MGTKVIGSKEERVNRFMMMTLEWQSDKRKKIERRSTYYFDKYNVGKVKQEFFNDIEKINIDREWAKTRMSEIRQYQKGITEALHERRRKEAEMKLLFEEKEMTQHLDENEETVNENTNEDVSLVTNDETNNLNNITDDILIKEIINRGYFVGKQIV